MEGEPPLDPNAERADSSEPRRARSNPFNEESEAPRKRVRLSESTSTSPGTSTNVDMDEGEPGTIPALVGQQMASEPSTPSRPKTPDPIAYKSNKVTLNLRSPHTIKTPLSPSTPTTPLEHTDTIIKDSIEPKTNDDDISNMPVVSSSESGETSPPVVLLIDDDPVESDDRHDVILVEDDVVDPMECFPGMDRSLSIENAVHRVAEELEVGCTENAGMFAQLVDWMNQFLDYNTTHKNVLENIREYRDFWIKFPDLIFRLNRRKNFFGDWLNKIQRDRKHVSDFFNTFATLTARILRAEVADEAQWNVSDASNVEPAIISRRFLAALAPLLKQNESTIGSSLTAHYGWDWDLQVMQMNQFFVARHGLNALTQHCKNLLNMAWISPRFFEALTVPTKILGAMALESLADPENTYIIVQQKADAADSRKLHHSYPPELASKILNEAWPWYSTMSQALEAIIEKHVTLLPPDSALSYLTSLTSILGACLDFEAGPKPAEQLLIDEKADTPQMPEKYLVSLVIYRWRIRILKKLITSSQMQLRVTGVTSLCGDLLTIFQTQKKFDGEPSQNKFIVHIAGLITEHKLVDYIVGTGSHPELIGQSSNIVGFLVVARTYSAANTDTIWRTITGSHNPQIVDQTCRMLGTVVNLLDLDALFYLCDKLKTVALDSFSAPMRELCDLILSHIIVKSSRDDFIDAAPYELCVHLIRGSSGYTSNASSAVLDVYSLSTKKFQEMLPFGPHPDVRKSIYATCIEDIGARSKSAPGSICLLSIMVEQMPADLNELVEQHGLTGLLIDEFGFAVKAETDPQLTHTTNDQTFGMRRDLLFKIISHFPGTITPLGGPKLWSLLVGEDSRSSNDRQIAWKALNGLATSLPNMNSFMGACVNKFLPTLPPHCFTDGCLDFVKIRVEKELLALPNSSADSFQELLSVKELWRIALTSLDGTVDVHAIRALIDFYFDGPEMASMASEETQKLHMDLVECSLDRLADAASKLKSSEKASPQGQGEVQPPSGSQANVSEHELGFRRSLIVLKWFLDEYQKRHGRDAAPLKVPAADQDLEPVGDKIKVHYQAFDGNKHSGMEHCEVGTQNSAADLFSKLSRAIGFDEYRVYYGGLRIKTDTFDLCKTLEELRIGSLPILLHRQENTETMSHGVGAFEAIIIQRFQELWSFLTLPHGNAKEICNFLLAFPIYDQLLAAFESNETAISDVFPGDQTYKGLYALHALQKHVEKQSRQGTLKEEIRGRMFGLVSTAFCSTDVLEKCTNEDLRTIYEYRFVECLSQLLKDSHRSDEIALHLRNTSLLDRLLKILTGTRGARQREFPFKLIAVAFSMILSASMYSINFWDNFKASNQAALFCHLLLEEDQQPLRSEISRQILCVCKATWISSAVSELEFSAHFWQVLVSLVPVAVTEPLKCQDFFHLALAVFKELFDLKQDSLDPQACLDEWGKLLVKHDVIQFVGRPGIVDQAAIGLARLVHWCALAAKSRKRELSVGNLAFQLFKKLFPAYSDPSSYGDVVENLPLLDTQTRRYIYETILLLCKEDGPQWQKVMSEVSDIVSYDYRKGEYLYDLPLVCEREKYIRSSTGYVGLRNLSNTCYLNSLFTQLFMNISFRDFMLKANVADGQGTQKLLHETQNLFTWMQNSLGRCVEPHELAYSIKTYEETRIDVNIQMDVDEFYNLLFDRWEGQMLAPEAKAEFRSFYGGQLVQQVKSKECPHISERLEPFSAIQCDIKGKSSLEESLQAYVNGEVMEGDNKYKCSTCDRHVDAVKRACLKDVPDNLIFHLKRFDFNLRTLQRNKINDHFAFPRTIDMRPYKVDHLMNPSEESPEDIFELVGILVHTGTAESGHYYSYIRERPSYGSTNTWVEFNDDTVTPFDPALIESNCFGGPDYRSPADNGNFHFDKVWSAYMLFYQRSSSIKSKQQALAPLVNLGPVHVPVDNALDHVVNDENQVLLRRYCLYDPYHAGFVAQMFENMYYINNDTCSPQHGIENKALEAVLNHFDQVVTRAVEIPDVTRYMACFLKAFRKCGACAQRFLRWLMSHSDALRNLLLRSPESVVRNSAAQLIIVALDSVSGDSSSSLDSDESDGSVDEAQVLRREFFAAVSQAVFKLLENFHQHTRAWPEFFQLLVNMASTRPQQVLWLDMGLLYKLLNIVTADQNLDLTPQLSKMLLIISRKNASRSVSWDSIIALLDLMLRACDLTMKPVEDHQSREVYLRAPKVPINNRELQVLTLHWTESRVNVLLEKLLALNSNSDATQSIVKQMMGISGEDDHVSNAIVQGLRRRAMLPVAPYLRSASTYCRSVVDIHSISNIYKSILHALQAVDYDEGKDFLQFFKDLHRLPVKFVNISAERYACWVIQELPLWAPYLLLRATPEVHAETEDFLRDVLFSKLEEPDLEASENIGVPAGVSRNIYAETVRSLGVACLQLLQDTFVRCRKQPIRSSLISITSIIDACRPSFEVVDPEDEIGPDDHDWSRMYETTLRYLESAAVEEVEDAASEWDESQSISSGHFEQLSEYVADAMIDNETVY